jgi:hypothetical protein
MKEIKTMTAAEKALRRIAEIDRDVDCANGAAMKLVEKAKANALLELEGKEAERQKLLELLEQFSDSKRDEIYADGKKIARPCERHNRLPETSGFRRSHGRCRVCGGVKRHGFTA